MKPSLFNNGKSTGLMYYRARYYAQGLGRFISADSIIPGAADGSGGGAATLGVDSSSRLTTLTTDFHEFIGQVTKENQAVLQYGAFFQWDEKVRKDNPVPSGPLNPQALNRYSYVLNNPLRYVDPTGHDGTTLHFNLTFNSEQAWDDFLNKIGGRVGWLTSEARTSQAEFAAPYFVASAGSMALVPGAGPLMAGTFTLAGMMITPMVGELFGNTQARDLANLQGALFHDANVAFENGGAFTLDLTIEYTKYSFGEGLKITLRAGDTQYVMQCGFHARCAGAQFLQGIDDFLNNEAKDYWATNGIAISDVR